MPRQALPSFLLALLLLLVCPARADVTAALVLDVQDSALDAGAVRGAVAAELRAPVLAPGDPGTPPGSRLAVVSVDTSTNELVVELRTGAFGTSRRVVRPGDTAEEMRVVTHLVANMARNEALDILGGGRRTPRREEPAVEERPARPQRAPEPPKSEPDAEEKPWRLWIGASAWAPFALMPPGSDVCSSESSGYTCTTMGGDPASQSIAPPYAPGYGGSVRSGMGPTAPHFAFSLERELSDNVLWGLAVGFTYNQLPSGVGGTVTAPLHFEARASYVFGHEPLRHAGVAPFVGGAFGAGEFDKEVDVNVTAQYGSYGPAPLQAWRAAGPAFFRADAGLRLAPAADWALLFAPTSGTLAVGSHGAAFLWTPSLSVAFCVEL